MSSFAALLAILTFNNALAQGGVLSGRVSNADGGRPLAGTTIQVLLPNGAVVASVLTRADGSYRLQQIPRGSYLVKVIALGFSAREFPGVAIGAGAAVTRDAALVAWPQRLEEVTAKVTGVSRSAEPWLDAPAPIFVITRPEVQERPALSVVEHLKSTPGVDISQGGLVQSNVVARGFNNIFSGALLTLIDYRAAAVPSLRVNVPAFFPISNDDIETIEVVLGPGAALYGPNASNGVLSIVTRSPFASPGTTLSLEAGARAGSRYSSDGTTFGDHGGGLARLSGRHAMRLGSKVAFKLSGSYLKGTEWRGRDTTESADLDTRHPELGIPAGRCNSRTGCRDFNLEEWSGEARVDVRPDARTEIIGDFGMTDALSLIEYTGVGAVQARGWKYTSGQLRFRRQRLFVQAFGNFTGAGLDGRTAPPRPHAYLLKDGSPIVDQSRVWSAQFQHGFDLFRARTSVLYGADYTRTDARTGGTINGLNENDDTIDEVGGYLHSVTHLTPRLDAVAALRVDKHNRLPSAVWSPRVALVFKPSVNQAFRITFNRAFSTPTNNDFFLDLRAEHQLVDESKGIGYDVRGLGVPSKGGFQYRVNGGCPGGVDGLCMRTPFDTAAGVLPADAALLWSAAVGAVCPKLLGAICQVTSGAPAPTSVGTQLRRLNAMTHQFKDVVPEQVIDIAPIKPTISSELELGYKALLGRSFQVSVDAWFEHKKDFGALVVESPSVFLDPATTIAYLTEVYTQAGIPGAAEVAAQVGTAMAGLSNATSAETTGVPLGTVVPTNTPLTARPDIFLTYRNFGMLNLWGADLALDFVVNRHLALSGSYAYVNKDFFPQAETHGPADVALNASRSKGSLTAAWRDDPRGWAAELRFRAVKGFPVISGFYLSAPDPNDPSKLLPTDSYGVLDVQGTWRPPVGARNLLISVNIQNLLNRHYATFVGLPQLGRLLLTKLSYTF